MVSEISCRNETGTRQTFSYLTHVEYDVAERLCPSFHDLGDDIVVEILDSQRSTAECADIGHAPEADDGRYLPTNLLTDLTITIY
jgi:hypothetical protein